MRWLWRTVPDVSGRPVPNTLPAISRWKILDNLRRSLLPPALVALFMAGWTVLPGSAWMWSAVAFMVLAFPAYTQVGRSLSSRVSGVPLREHVLAERDALDHQRTPGAALDGVPPPSELGDARRDRADARSTADHEAAAARNGSRSDRIVERRDVSGRGHSPSMVAGAGRPRSCSRSSSAPYAPGTSADRPVHPGALVRLATDGLRDRSDRSDTGTRHSNLDEQQILHRIARQTWRFFDELVGPADNWLIPDNVQENRRERIAHRTSPTNIGLQLLSTLVARDFGYVTTTELVARLEPTFKTLLRMERYRGHFYNWYDTETLGPLSPAYISTVDRATSPATS